MYQVEFFVADNGACDVGDWLDELRQRAPRDKNARVQLRQVTYAIERLEQFGTRNPEEIVRSEGDGLWELRPGDNRVLLFHYTDGKFILLHHFRKTTRKTPPLELERAKEERKAYLRRQGGNKT